VIQALLSLVLVLLAVGLLTAGAVILLMARLLLRPPRMTDGKALYLLRRLSPNDLGLEFEPVEFVVRDEQSRRPLRLAGWWIPQANPSSKCAVMVHGYGDAKVGAIAWAPTLHALGFNILAIDLRAHGESGGRYATAGYWERHDLNQVINQLLAERPRQTRQLVLFGVSMGAAVAAATAVMREDLSAVVLECPFLDYRRAVAAHARQIGLPAGLLQRVAMGLAEWMSGANFDAVRPVELIPEIPCPLMIVQSAADPLVEPEHISVIEEAARAHADRGLHTHFWKVDDAYHVEALLGDQELYRQKLEHFFESALHAPVRIG
jgi:uncharacterized protein